LNNGEAEDPDSDIKITIIEELTRKSVTLKRDLKKTGIR